MLSRTLLLYLTSYNVRHFEGASMRISQPAISLNVDDPKASAAFLTKHFGFTIDMQDTGFISLSREDAGFNVVYLQTGLKTFKPITHAAAAGAGILVVFVVDDIDAEWDLLRDAAHIVTPIETESWGERFFQVLDPNGIVIQLVQWV